jgi:hypothetical protein
MGSEMPLTNLVAGDNMASILGRENIMKIDGITQQEIIAEFKPKSNVNSMKERNLRILYSCLGIGIVLLVAGLVLLFTQ